tara:strand:- start:207 stop:839 length:633 start_codon:yes stop_codon:yes gene_type:complete
MDVLVIGTGGLAREFSAFFSDEINIIGFSSTEKIEFEKFKLPGRFFDSKITPKIVGTKNAVLAIGDPIAKQTLSKKLKKLGFIFPNLVHPSSIMYTNINKASQDGIIVSPNCVIGTDVSLGNHVYLNFMVGIGHDVVIEDYVQVNSGAQIGGNVLIGEGVLVGSGSTIREKLKIKKLSTIGSGSVVLSSVSEGITVIGNPARRLKLPKIK